MQNILADITAQNWILALFIRDDGERFLLGTGAYEFKKSLQHFQPNTYANDVVELQGTDGQLLAGQVRRTAPQSFDGYIADQTISQQATETRRRAFLMFFRKKHFYTVAYILPNGTAIQRRRGYITDAPAVSEMIQRWPEYHVALNFEDPNYYEYAEDEDGNPIYAHEVELAIAGASVGGLVWDEDGVVWDGGIDWRTLQTVQGPLINLDNAIDIRALLSSVELLGNTTQNGTPTPDAPVAVQTTTGEQVVEMRGKNLLKLPNAGASSGITYSINSDGTFNLHGTNSAGYEVLFTYYIDSTEFQSTNYTLSANKALPDGAAVRLEMYNGATWKRSFVSVDNSRQSQTGTPNFTDANRVRVAVGVGSGKTVNIDNLGVMLEKSSSATDFEPYQSQSYDFVLIAGKNIFDKSQAITYKWLNASTGQLTNSSDPNVVTPYMRVRVGKTYTFSGINDLQIRVFGYENTTDNKKVTYINNSRTSRTFTATYPYMRASIGGGDAVSLIDAIQCEEGSSATAFEACQPIELCKLGTYQDKIYKSGDDWFVHREVENITFDGSADESWTVEFSNSYYRAKINVAGSDTTAVRRNMRSDHFHYKSSGHEVGAGFIYGGQFFAYPEQTITTASAFKTWLASNPTKLYYFLAAPTDTQITNQALIDQLDALASSTLFVGENNIALVPSGGAQGELKIIYPTDYALTGGAIWSIGGSGGQNIITVDGVDSAFPVWEVIGPTTNPTLTNTTTGQSITWNGTVPNGQSLVVDMGEQTATMAGANVFQYIDGQWIRLDAGNNTLTYTATGATAPSILSWNGVVG